MPLDIQVGQHWLMRNGGVVHVTFDRGDSAVNGWRWVLSNSQIVNDAGRAELNDVDGPYDLIKLQEQQ